MFRRFTPPGDNRRETPVGNEGMAAMLIYAAADMHGHPRRIAAVVRRVRAHRPDVVILAGDIVGRRHPEAALEILNRMGPPVLVIGGNSDYARLPRLTRAFPRLQTLDMRSQRLGRLRIVGAGGTLCLPLHSRLRLREKPIAAALCTLLAPDCILVTHPPPYGIQDRVLGRWHAGSRMVRRLVETHAPAVVICGHIHEGAGIARLPSTLVVNCAVGRIGSGALIRYDGVSAPTAELLPPGEPPDM